MDNPDSTTSAAPATAGALRALLIGINGYANVRPLAGCVNDVLAVHQFLTTQAQFPREQIQVLVAPSAGTPAPADLGLTVLPTRANILAALKTLAEQAQPGDHVVVYYSGHGVNIANPTHSTEQIGALVPCDARAPTTNFLINRDLNAAVRAIAKITTLTMILDCCHSGGATRGVVTPDTDADAPSVRELVIDPDTITAAAWTTLMGGSAATVAEERIGGDTDSRDVGGSGWGGRLSATDELIVLSGCRDVETAQEFTPPGHPRRGAMTLALLDALQTVSAAPGNPNQIAPTTWNDIYPLLRQRVQGLFPAQTPTLEGRSERPVFGGAWHPFAPGFTVTRAGTTLTVNGGQIHGLDEGAELALYPPKTADFLQADQAGGLSVTAVVVGRSSPIQSTIRVTGEAMVADQARARLTKPSAYTPRLKVSLKDLPAALATAIQADQVPVGQGGAGRGEISADFLDVCPADSPDSEVEVRRFRKPNDSATAQPDELGWAIVPYSNAETTLTWNDVIGWAPDVTTFVSPDMSEATATQNVGNALRRGLIHWAKYWATLHRSNPDARLRGKLQVSLERGLSADPDWNDDAAWHLVSAEEATVQGIPGGRYDQYGNLLAGTPAPFRLRVALAADSPALSVGILLCSNDGNIILLWPPENAENILQPGKDKRVGNGGNLEPITLSVDRSGQTQSVYTFKVFAAAGQLPIELSSLQLDDTVQGIIDTLLGGRGGVRPVPRPPAEMLWTTVEVPVLIRL